jgi:hypothetical protein
MFGFKKIGVATAAAAVLLPLMSVLGPNAAHAATISFERITSNSSIDASSQLSVVASDEGTEALFSFSVLSGAQSGASISEIYFSDTLGLFTPLPLIRTEQGVSFVAGSASPPNLPGGNNATPPFQVTDFLLADATGRNSNAIQIGDLLVLGLVYSQGSDFADLQNALQRGEFRIGLHVRALEGGESDSFVSTAAPIPLPAAGWLLLTAVGGLGFAARRRRKAS